MATFIQQIIGVQITPDASNAQKLQELFTNYGNIIKTRLGLNHLDDEDSALNAVIILELYGNEAQINHFQNELQTVQGLKVGKLTF